MTAKIPKGNIVGKENPEGFVVGKWKDKKEVSFLSTNHGIDLQAPAKKIKRDKMAIIEYNKDKEGVDISDQVASFFSSLRKTVCWYHKDAFELLLNTTVVNSWIIMESLKNQRISITELREKLIIEILGVSKHKLAKEIHKLIETDDRTRQNRKKKKE